MRELILNNFWLKVFSLVLASLIWFVLHSNLQTEGKYPPTIFRPTQTLEFRCPVTLLLSPSDEGKYQLDPTMVTVRISGDSSTVLGLDSRDVQPYVDLTSVRDPEGAFKVSAIVPKDVSLRSISPSHIYVRPAG